MIERVSISAAVERQIREFAGRAYPHEGCGVLIGSYVDHGVRVIAVTSGRNLWTARAADRYDLDPGDILAAQREATATGLDVVGYWHSHPDHQAWPSQFDTDRAWVDYVYLIVNSVAGGTGDLGAFRLGGEGEPFDAVRLQVGEA